MKTSLIWLFITLSVQQCFAQGKMEQFMETRIGRRTMKWAQRGNRHAQLDLGKAYFHADEKESFEHAFYWLEQASAQGSAEASFYLGKLYAEGLSVSQDLERAMELWREAVNAGYNPAFSAMLEVMLELEDYDAASEVLLEWEALAHTRDCLRIAEYYSRDLPIRSDQRAADLTLRFYLESQQILPNRWAIELLEKAIDLGSQEAKPLLEALKDEVWLKER